MKQYKKCIISLSLCFGLFVTNAAAYSFQDVKSTDWFQDGVQYVYDRGLMHGTTETTFSPQQTTSRGMIVAILYRLTGSPAVTSTCPFTDVGKASYYKDAVTWAAANGIVTGYNETTFEPDDSITRQQMAAILYRYANFKKLDTSINTSLNKYKDYGQIMPYAKIAFAWANALGFINGTSDTTLEPQGKTTRAQVAAILTRFCKKVALPKDDEFVRVRDYIPDIWVELMYATDRNFTNQVIYNFSDAWLRYGTVKKLSAAQDIFRQKGYYLKIWDGFRPTSAQFKLWAICPDSRYVANPEKGFSSHSRGNTVDVTLVNAEGEELPMPTDFDNFTSLADRDYSDIKDTEVLKNVKFLEDTMTDCGFKPYSGEWWHFSDIKSYEVSQTFQPLD